MKHYVYILKRPDGTPFYVGKGVRNRMYKHIWEAKNKPEHNPYKSNVINKILAKGEKLNYEVVEFFDTDEAALLLEKKLISKIGRSPKGPLTNLTAGGERGRPGLKHKKSTIEKMKKNHIGFTGKTHLEKSKKLISKALSGANNPMYGKKHTSKTIDKIKRNRVWKKGAKHYLSKVFIVTFPNALEVKVIGLMSFCRNNKLTPSAMYSCASGDRNRHKGYKCRKYNFETDSNIPVLEEL